MKSLQILLSATLLAASLGANAEETTKPVTGVTSPEALNVFSVSPCKPSGDGTYTEIITTMASVLPPAAAEAFLERYCDQCNKKKFAAARAR